MPKLPKPEIKWVKNEPVETRYWELSFRCESSTGWYPGPPPDLVVKASQDREGNWHLRFSENLVQREVLVMVLEWVAELDTQRDP